MYKHYGRYQCDEPGCGADFSKKTTGWVVVSSHVKHQNIQLTGYSLNSKKREQAMSITRHWCEKCAQKKGFFFDENRLNYVPDKIENKSEVEEAKKMINDYYDGHFDNENYSLSTMVDELICSASNWERSYEGTESERSKIIRVYLKLRKFIKLINSEHILTAFDKEQKRIRDFIRNNK